MGHKKGEAGDRDAGEQIFRPVHPENRVNAENDIADGAAANAGNAA